MKLLFITRKYPPSKGGMENAAYFLHRALADRHSVKLVAWGGSNKWLAGIYPYLLLRGLFSALFSRPDAVYLQDGMLSPMAWVFHGLLRIPTIITLHGLDITYKRRFYQFIVRNSLKSASLAIAVSRATAEQAKRRAKDVRCIVINNGVNDGFFIDEPRAVLISRICEETGLSKGELEDKKVLLTTGRLVPRKGVSWFVGEVMPELARSRKDIVYLVAGTGPEAPDIRNLIKNKGLDGHVKLLGEVSGKTVKQLYNAADLFVMPNIPVKGDMEGFGLVALEAGSCGTPVLASDIEGIKDAINSGENGTLVEPQSKDAYIRIIKKLLKTGNNQPKSIRKYVIDNYSWNKVADRYSEEIAKTTEGKA